MEAAKIWRGRPDRVPAAVQEEIEHVFTSSRRRCLPKAARRFARSEASRWRTCTDRQFQDGQAAFPQGCGAVEVIKDGEQIAKVSAPGSVFGEQALLLDQPHTADVRTLEQSQFYVADAQAMLANPAVALYVAATLARRLDAANRSLVEVKRQLQADEPRSVISKTVEKVEDLLSYSDDASLVYSGYPYDPFRPEKSKR